MDKRIDTNKVMDWRYSWTPENWSFTGTWKQMFKKLGGDIRQYSTIWVSEPGEGKFKKIGVVGKSFKDKLTRFYIHDEIEFIE